MLGAGGDWLMNQRFRNTVVKGSAGAALMALALGASASLLLAQSAPAKVPDLSGFWERRDDVGGGNFGGILEKIVPKASLTPEVVKANQETAARQAQGEVVAFGSKWCLSNLYPFFMQHSAAWDLFQTQTEIMQAAKHVAAGLSRRCDELGADDIDPLRQALAAASAQVEQAAMTLKRAYDELLQLKPP